MPVSFKFYDEDGFCKDYNALPQEAQSALLAYLNRLQQQPDSPDLRTQSYGADRFAYIFHSQYVVYCHVERDSTTVPEQVVRFEILAVESLNRVLREPDLDNGIVAGLRRRLGI